MVARNQSISLTLVSPLSAIPETPTTGSGSDSLVVEQPNWPTPPDGGLAEWLATNNLAPTPENIQKYADTYKPWCNEEGKLQVKINVPATKSGNPYSIKPGYGEISPAMEESSEHKRSQKVEAASSYDIGAKVNGDVRATWDGPVLAKDGSTIANPPAIKQEGSILSWDGEVTGSLRLAYTETHDTYTVTLTPRPADQTDPTKKESAYESTIYLVGDDGEVVTHDIDLPDMSGLCPGETDGTTAPEDKDKEGTGGCVRHNILINPCTGEVIREWDEKIECPE